ncbi:MAG: ABC transporter ATP-binding protein [Defluviitaleaceae bacterium]|nr:ABC transporter ATP-binding protein [Defluviitaleaceae bacterium]MCL2240694.1 ABC transporter ATP-binding protein [Defluviitaleaceae bacterium]
MRNAVAIQGMNKKFGKKEVFRDLSLAFPAGRVIGLLGENGIGKTTLLRLIADILKPNNGEIRVGGEIVSRKTRGQVSFMLAPENFYSFMKVRDAVQYFRDFFPDFDHKRAERLCEEFGLKPKEIIKKMSKGQQERLCILLCLCRRVPLYLLDEPIAGLDPKFKHESIKAMLANTDEEQTVIISSHLLRDLETVFDEIFILKQDGVVQANCDDIRAQGKSVEAFYLEVAAE